MESHESMTAVPCIQQDGYGDIDVGFEHDHDHNQPHPHNLSRLSVCTSSMYTNDDDDIDDDLGIYMSRLSMEGFDADIDEEEFLDEKRGKVESLEVLSSDSDKEPGCYSLPATPPRRRKRRGVLSFGVKDYASENEAYKGRGRSRDLRKRRIIRERWESMSKMSSLSAGESEGTAGAGAGDGGGVVVITKPKGGRNSLCMDMEEVKACRDLGFELEHESMLATPTLDTASSCSGGNSPIANWRISSPG